MKLSLALSPRQTAQAMIVIIFLLGVSTGYSVASLWTVQGSSSSSHKRKFIDEFCQAFKLNENQRQKAEEIFRDADKQHREIRLQLQPQFAAINERTSKRIRSILSPAQLEAYDRWASEISSKSR